MFSDCNVITKYVEIINQKSADIVFSDILFSQRNNKKNIKNLEGWQVQKT